MSWLQVFVYKLTYLKKVSCVKRNRIRKPNINSGIYGLSPPSPNPESLHLKVKLSLAPEKLHHIVKNILDRRL